MYGIQYPLPPRGVPLVRVDNPSYDFNWGIPSDMPPGWSYRTAVARLSEARLSELEIVLIEGLHLGSEYADHERDAFEAHMRLFTQYCNGVVVDTRWIEALLTFVPPFVFDGEQNGLIDDKELADTATQYLRRGFGAPLTALYLLTLRSNYWQSRFGFYHPGDLVGETLERKQSEALGYSFAQILGDPFTSPSTSTWDYAKRSDYFLVREDLSHLYLEAEPESDALAHLRSITAAMLLLAAIAGGYIGGRLKKYLGEYSSWLNEYVLAENGGNYPVHMS